jgi:hypothetical protein
MLKKTARIATRIARATTTIVGLAIMLALIFGVSTTAIGATGSGFLLGKGNTAGKQTSLVGNVVNLTQSALMIKNGAGGSALELRVVDPDTTDPSLKDVAPMKVDSQAKVTNLNADEIDGKDSTDFYAAGSKVDSAHIANSAYQAQDANNANTLNGHPSNYFAPRAVEPWHVIGSANEPGFQNGWTNFDPNGFFSTAAFYKDPYGVVHLKGVVKGGTVSHNSSGIIFMLPYGYGSEQDEVHAVLSNEGLGRVTIERGSSVSDGRTVAYVHAAPPSNSAWVSLDGITFRAAGPLN